MLGLYPARGCPFLCNFCSVIKIAGGRFAARASTPPWPACARPRRPACARSCSPRTTSTSTPRPRRCWTAMVDERLGLEFFVQCDTQIARQEHLVDLLAKAGCFQMFVGVESFNRQTLLAAHKGTEPSGDVPRHRAPVPRARNQFALFQHHWLSAKHGARKSTSTCRCCASWTRPGLPSTSSARFPAPSSTTTFWPGLITEKNLDRFDTTCLTWRGPQRPIGFRRRHSPLCLPEMGERFASNVAYLQPGA
jgi:hypothetical protein